MTDYVELCCICEVQHEGAEINDIDGDLYCDHCKKLCTCIVCGSFQLVPCGNRLTLNGVDWSQHNQGFKVKTVDEFGAICQPCADKIRRNIRGEVK